MIFTKSIFNERYDTHQRDFYKLSLNKKLNACLYRKIKYF